MLDAVIDFVGHSYGVTAVYDTTVSTKGHEKTKYCQMRSGLTVGLPERSTRASVQPNFSTASPASPASPPCSP